MAAYAAAKARALTGEVALAVIDDPGAAALLAASPAGLAVPITQRPAVPRGARGAAQACWWTRRSAQDELLAVDARPAGRRAQRDQRAGRRRAGAGRRGRGPRRWRRVCGSFTPAGTAMCWSPSVPGSGIFDDSKATNPHAALASLQAYPRVVWVAGGQLKGASVDDLVRRVGDRLAGVVLLGVDAPIIAAALSRHAPDVPVQLVPGKDDDVMRTVVSAAAAMAAPGDVVLLAPAAASLDMYSSYAARGDAFAAAARRCRMRRRRRRRPTVSVDSPPSTETTTDPDDRTSDASRRPTASALRKVSASRPDRARGPVGRRRAGQQRLAVRPEADRRLARPADDVAAPGAGDLRADAGLRPADGAVVVVGGGVPRRRLVVLGLREPGHLRRHRPGLLLRGAFLPVRVMRSLSTIAVIVSLVLLVAVLVARHRRAGQRRPELDPDRRLPVPAQ